MAKVHRALIGTGVAIVIAGSIVTFGTPSKVSAASNITFATPQVMDPIHNVGEPTIVRSPAQDNTVYGSGPWGSGTQRSIWDASADGGETFRIVSQCAPVISGQVTQSCQAQTPPSAAVGSPNPPGGGDTDQRLDHNGKDYFADLWALACDRVATTTNGGASAPQNAYGCNAPTTSLCTTGTNTCRPDGSDRQWLAVYDPPLTGVTTTAPDAALAPLTYMEYNNLQTTQTNAGYWVKSTDGLNYTPANSNDGNWGPDGYPAVDQVTGDVFQAAGNGSTLLLNIGEPDAAGNLCFLDDPAAITIGTTAHACHAGGGNSIGNALIPVASGLLGSPDLLFTVASMDLGRNLHITWAINGGNNLPRYQVFTSVASAATQWKIWATPVQLSQSPSNVNVFPWMVAGGPGRSDSVWYGDSCPTGTCVNPSSTAANSHRWDVYMNQAVWPVDATGAVTLAAPLLNFVKVTPHPMDYLDICLSGTGCITSQGNRNLADFFSITIDHNGAADVMYNDISNGMLQPGFTSTTSAADHPGAPVVTIAHQDSGPGLLGAQVPNVATPGTNVVGLANEPTSAPTTGMVDPAGDGKYPVIGGSNQPAYDFTANQLALSANNATLTVTMKVNDLSPLTIFSDMANVTGSATVQYVTRWQMGNTIYYAMMETNAGARAAGGDQFYAGTAQSIDLCSVSACDPHVIYYPETPSPGSNSETTGSSVSCPATPGPTTPCTITISVNAAHVGSPTQSSLLEEVGSYVFGAARPMAAITNPQAEADQLPLEVDGICCFNFMGTTLGPNIPETPWTPALIGLGAALIAGGVVLRRRRGATPIA